MSDIVFTPPPPPPPATWQPQERRGPRWAWRLIDWMNSEQAFHTAVGIGDTVRELAPLAVGVVVGEAILHHEHHESPPTVTREDMQQLLWEQQLRQREADWHQGGWRS